MIAISRTVPSSTHFAIWAVLAISALFSGNATADIYRCKLKSGEIEMRDFPCEASSRPPTPSSQRSPPTAAEPTNGNLPAYGTVPNSANSGQYEASKAICMRLITQYDFTGPLLRCNLDDANCVSRANQESNAIFQRLTSLPEWKRHQCDQVVQVEAASPTHKGKAFEVVGVIRGCKFFIAEQQASYSLIDESMCFRPSRGDQGYGDISSFGMKEVKLNGLACTLYVDDWALGRNRAADKLRNKCR